MNDSIHLNWFNSTQKRLFKNISWAPIYWSPGSIILEPRLQYIGAPLVQKTCFLFYFWTWNTTNKRFPVHYLDHHVTHKTWFYQNSPSSFLPRILKIKFRGSNTLEPGSNILEPPHLPDCLFRFALSIKHKVLKTFWVKKGVYGVEAFAGQVA